MTPHTRFLTYAVMMFFVACGAFCQNAQASNATDLSDFKMAKQALNQKDYTQAIALLTPLADAKHPRAQFELARLYEDGSGVKKNLHRAETLYKQSAENGYARAHEMLGRLYEKYPALIKNTTTSHKTSNETAYLTQIQNGDLSSAENLARIYEYGLGTTKDKPRALGYYMIAANYGSASAAQRVTRLSEQLTLTELTQAQRNALQILTQTPPKKSNKQAFRAFTATPKNSLTTQEKQGYSAAKNEYAQAISAGYLKTGRRLGALYEHGRGTSKDPIQALTYYYIAARDGSENAAMRANKLAMKMSPVDVKRAENMANNIIAAREAKQVKNAVIPRRRPRWVGAFKTQYIGEENGDLGTRQTDFESSLVADARLGLYLYPSQDITTYLEGRSYASSGVATSDNEDSSDAADAAFIEMRQAWVNIDKLMNDPRLSMKIGRQRFREDRSFWWNRDLDALRLRLKTKKTDGFIAVGQNLSNYRLGDDDKFQDDDKDRLRVLAELSRQLNTNHSVSARALYEKDHSGLENIGTSISADNRDDEDFNLLWLGLRSAGTFDKTPLSYRLDSAIVTGEEDLLDSTNTNDGRRTVTGSRTRDVMGWAFDGALNLQTHLPLTPSFSLGYAYGSGDDTPGGNNDTDNAFRQSDLEGNRQRSATGLHNYGEVLRPELSNLHIARAGVHLPLFSTSDFDLNYYSYWLDKEGGGLRSAGITGNLTGGDSHLGQALDLGVNIALAKEMDLNLPSYIRDVSTRLRLGIFRAGDAYTPEDGEIATRASTDLNFRF